MVEQLQVIFKADRSLLIVSSTSLPPEISLYKIYVFDRCKNNNNDDDNNILGNIEVNEKKFTYIAIVSCEEPRDSLSLSWQHLTTQLNCSFAEFQSHLRFHFSIRGHSNNTWLFLTLYLLPSPVWYCDILLLKNCC